jgi:hypothetical protein
MTEDVLERLRAESSRGNYASMARLAQALYEAGLSPREVLRSCYGHDFPEEFFVIAEAQPLTPHLLVVFTNQPWLLAIPPDHGGPMSAPNLMEDAEERIFARDPDLIPLLLLLGSEAKYGELVLCYRLTELAASRTTIFGIEETADPGDEVERCGDSLLAVLREHHAEIVEKLEWQQRQPSNHGAGSVDAEEVAEVRALVARVEELQREVSAREHH